MSVSAYAHRPDLAGSRLMHRSIVTRCHMAALNGKN